MKGIKMNHKTGDFYVEETWQPLSESEIGHKYSHDHQELMSFTYDGDRHCYVYVFAEVYN